MGCTKTEKMCQNYFLKAIYWGVTGVEYGLKIVLKHRTYGMEMREMTPRLHLFQLDDPDKQRKWEEREHRRELKKRTPKMKQVKVGP